MEIDLEENQQVVKYNGEPFVVVRGNEHYVSKTIRATQNKGGCWDKEAQDLVIEHADPTKVFIDVGGQIGTWTITMSRVFDKVVSFEPNTDYQKFLLKNVELSEQKNITVIRKAAGNHNAKGTLITKYKSRISFDDKGAVEVVKIDDEFDNLGISHAEVGCIKIDTEGFESQVLEGLAKIFDKSSPLVYLETHPGIPQYPNAVADAEEKMREYGYAPLKELSTNAILWKKE